MKLSQMSIMIVSGMLIASVLACGGGSSSAPTVEPVTNGGGTTGSTGSSGSTTEAAPVTFTACDLLQQIDATSFFQTQANPAEASSAGKSTTCTYASDAGDQLSITLTQEAGDAKSSSDFTSARTSESVAVSSVGDDAYYTDSTHQMTVAKGQWMFVVSGSIKGTPVGQDFLTQVGTFVVLRILSLTS